MRFLDLLRKPRRSRRARPAPRKTALGLEALETRLMPYATSGNLWPHPERITLSFEPDGTNLGGPTSNLFATFNAAFGSTAAWENVILKAAQSWAQQTNINLSVVSDNGAASGSGGDQQGDPGFGDIRIGGYNFNNKNILAAAYLPPPVNNYSVGGDLAFNTAQVFNINGLDYDLYSVALHEFGHALGMEHSTDPSAIMFSSYTGAVSGPNADDAAGIRSIYSNKNLRSLDAYAAAGNNYLATASDLTSTITAGSLTSVVTGLNLSTAGQVEYYKFTAPSGGTGQLTVSVQSQGLSLLAPSLRIYNANQSLVATATGSGDLGSTLTRTITVTPGQRYFVRVAGANTSAFGTGAYALTLNFGTGGSPSVSPPGTQVSNGNPLSGGGGVADATNNSGATISDVLNPLLAVVGDVVGGLLGALSFLDLLTINPARPPTFSAPGTPAGDPAVTQPPDASTAVVTALYDTVLSRAPDAAGLQFWVHALEAGVPRLQVAQGFWESSEHRGLQVDQLYATILHRAADTAGRAAWVGAFQAGLGETDVARGLLTSPEYAAAHPDPAAFAAGVYRDVLGRDADATGLAAGRARAGSPGGRDAVAEAVLTSPEAQRQFVDGYYTELLGRAPDAAGEQVWQGALHGGPTSADGVAEAFLASDEFFANVSTTPR